MACHCPQQFASSSPLRPVSPGTPRPDVDRPLWSHPCENMCPHLGLNLDGVLRLLPLCHPPPCPRHGGLAPLHRLIVPLRVRPVLALVCGRKPGSDLVLSFPRPVLPRRPDHTLALLARFMLRRPPAPVAMAAFPNCLMDVAPGLASHTSGTLHPPILTCSQPVSAPPLLPPPALWRGRQGPWCLPLTSLRTPRVSCVNCKSHGCL